MGDPSEIDPGPVIARMRWRRWSWSIARWMVGLAIMVGLGVVYYRGAVHNAAHSNQRSQIGDQSAYMTTARDLYKNRHEGKDILGDRNRMPLYPWIQSFFYEPQKSEPPAGRRSGYDARRDNVFFERGKLVNIRMSMVILVVLFFVFRAHLGTLAATSSMMVLAFGVFIFKAGYFQSELLFYFVWFVAFLLMCHFLKRPTLWLAPLAGVAAAVAHLTKAAMVPLVAMFAAVFLGREVVVFIARWRNRERPRPRPPHVPGAPWRIVALPLMLGSFFGTLWPYISNSKRAFGHYFYNVNSTFYIWYDKWADVSRGWGTKRFGDREHWPNVPAEHLPGPLKYWREHTRGQIWARFASGFRDIWHESYDHYGYFWYVIAWTGLIAILLAIRPRWSCQMIRSNWNGAVLLFMTLYCATYLPLTAFYAPISQTGTTRFLLAHLAPLLFVFTYLTVREPFRSTGITLGRARVTPAWFHAAVILSMVYIIPYHVWPRLMDASKFGGF